MNQNNEDTNESVMLDGADAIGFLALQDERRSSITSSIRKCSLTKIIVPDLIVHNELENHTKQFVQSQLGWTREGEEENVSLKNDEIQKCTKKKELKGFKRYWGISLGIFSSFIFSIGILIVKLLKDHHPFSVALWRFHGILLPSIPIILYTTLIKKENIFKPIHPICQPGKFKVFLLLFLRSTTGCFAAVLHYYSMQYMPMPDATVIAFSTPVLVTFLAHIFLKEECGVVNVFSAFVTLVGVLVIIRPPFLTGETEMNMDLLIGCSMAMGSMALASCVYLLLRLLKGLNYAVVTLFFGIYGTIECAILALIMGVFKAPGTNTEWLLAVGLGITIFTGQATATIAAKYDDAAIVAITRTFDVMFTFIWQFIFLGIQPTVFSLVGSLIVITGVSLIIIRKYLLGLPTDHSARQRFSLLMK